MRRISILTALLALPVSAAALGWSDLSGRYSDARFTSEERAAVSLLTEVGAVQGYADGTFRPASRINRAEFLKIAIASLPVPPVTPCDHPFWTGAVGLCLPDGWEEVAPADVTDKTDAVLAFQSPAFDRTRRAALIIEQAGLLDLSSSAIYSSQKIDEAMSWAFYTLVSKTDVDLDGQTVSLHVFTAQEPKAFGIKTYYQLSGLRGRTGFTATVAVDDDIAASWDALLRDAVSSLTFTEQETSSCFHDVRASDWFAPYVCAAKDLGVVGGFPDGLFHPERPLNYDQALKMLVSLHGLPLRKLPGQPWYAPYVDAATSAGLLLQGVRLDEALTRGEMARLAAAFRAHAEGELDRYRRTERGEWRDATALSSSSVASSASSSVQSSASSSAPVAAAFTLPAVSRIVLLGEATPQPVADGAFLSDEDAVLRAVFLRFDRKIASVRSVEVTDAQGRTLFTLLPDNVDNDPLTNADRTWRWSGLTSDTAAILPAGVPTALGVRVVLNPFGLGGVPQETVRVTRFEASVTGVTSNAPRQLNARDTHFPSHLTANAQITRVESLLTGEQELVMGQGKVVGSFGLRGSAQAGGNVGVTALDFTVESQGLHIPRWRLTSEDGSVETDCSVDSSDKRLLTCPVPLTVRDVAAGQVYKLVADLSPEAFLGEKSLRVSLVEPGELGKLGAVRWTDGSLQYSWVPLPAPLAVGPLWR